MKLGSLFVWLGLCTSLFSQAPAALSFFDVTRNSAPLIGGFNPNLYAITPGHLVRLTISGNPGDRIFLALSNEWPSTTVTIGGVSIGIDIPTMVVFWDGISNPASAPTIPASGNLDLVFSAPFSNQITQYFHVQAAVRGASGPTLITNHLDLRWSGVDLFVLESGGSSTHPLALGSGGLIILTDNASWTSFYAAHAGASSPVPPVNFTSNFVIAKFLGSVQLGQSLTITDALLDLAGVLQVYTQIAIGGPPPPPIVVQPYEFVLAPVSISSTIVNENVTWLLYP